MSPVRRFGAALFLLFTLTSALASAPIYSIDGTAGPPSDEETLYVEYLNRARMYPAAEGAIMANTTDPDVVAAYNYFSVDLAKMQSEFEALSPLPPVAFNAQLNNDARGHTQDQFDFTYQGHTGSDGSTIASRATAAGYNYTLIAENVYSFADSVFHGHAGFEVDWGGAPPPDGDGMQNPRGHRNNIHNPNAREIGVGVVLGTKSGNNLDGNPTTVGPQLVTEELGARSGLGPLLTGVAYFDFSGDHFYSVGEGLGQITVTVDGASYSAITTPSGAFTVPLPFAGTYTVTFSGHGLSQSATVTSTGGENVKLDFVPTFAPAILSGPTSITAGTPTAYSVTAAPGATSYTLNSYHRDLTPVVENAEDAVHFTADVSGYDPVQTAVHAQGAAAFNLKHPTGTDQTLTLNRVLFIRTAATLSFASRLCVATPAEIAKVQISTDNGTSWTDVYSQDGPDQPGETTFTTRSVDLSAYANKICLVRFRFDSTGSYYPSGGSGQPIGWYIDAIAFTNTEELTGASATALGDVASFNYTAPAPGSYLLSLTPVNVARALPASDALLVTATSFSGTAPSITTEPVGTTVNDGTTVTLTVAASGTAPLSYQWLKDDVAIAGATSSTLSLASATPSDSGTYQVTVSNGGGSVTSSGAVVVVNAVPPSISTQPVGATVNAGETVTLTVVASGSGTLSYQWSKDDVAIGGATNSTLTLASAIPADSGTYQVTVSNGGGSVTSSGAVVSVTGVAPTISTPPVGATVNEGETVTLTVAASGSGTLSYQWSKDGVPIGGATADTLTLTNPTAANSGSYTVTITNAAGQVTSTVATVTVNPAPVTGDASYLANLSVRAAMTEGQTLIVGFVVDGGSKPILVRAAGPALNDYGLTGVADPRLTVFNSQSVAVGSNNDWSSTLKDTFATLGAFPFADGSKDAALLATLTGPHTAQVTGTGNGTILVEAYDAGANDGPKLVNLSARFHVGTGNNILIAGFVLNGTGTKNLLIRAIGPKLATYGVAGTLVDPQLAVYDGGAVVAQNDNWAAPLASTFSQLGAFDLDPGSKDAALIVTLAAGKGYTVQVSGVDNGTGEALVEIYAIP